jgi:hypothetical protein
MRKKRKFFLTVDSMSKCGHIAEFFKPSFEVLINHKEE